jgi:hypothetical protein
VHLVEKQDNVGRACTELTFHAFPETDCFSAYLFWDVFSNSFGLFERFLLFEQLDEQRQMRIVLKTGGDVREQ